MTDIISFKDMPPITLIFDALKVLFPLAGFIFFIPNFFPANYRSLFLIIITIFSTLAAGMIELAFANNTLWLYIPVEITLCISFCLLILYIRRLIEYFPLFKELEAHINYDIPFLGEQNKKSKNGFPDEKKLRKLGTVIIIQLVLLLLVFIGLTYSFKVISKLRDYEILQGFAELKNENGEMSHIKSPAILRTIYTNKDNELEYDILPVLTFTNGYFVSAYSKQNKDKHFYALEVKYFDNKSRCWEYFGYESNLVNYSHHPFYEIPTLQLEPCK